ncbi:hypothetical protein QQF64_032872 [Cirrhinus molitorella]|uniref:Uncharacterized protein n=1 Tax=Cirrhinus molitorella TaxID=172907 RepID=A0ABR3MSA7_9TELE
MSGALVWATRVAECSHLPELWLLPSARSSQASPLVERAQSYELTSCAHLLPLVRDPTCIPHAHGSYTTKVKAVGPGGHEQQRRAYSCQWQQTPKPLLCVWGSVRLNKLHKTSLLSLDLSSTTIEWPV